MVGADSIEDFIKMCLTYDPETGELFWKPRSEELFSSSESRTSLHKANNWNSKNAGKKAFTAVGSHGYRMGAIQGRRFLSHRVAFLLQTGGWPPDTIDHINGDKLDNRWSNLRAASRAQNNQNKKGHGKTSPYVGVYWNASLKGYMARVYCEGKSYYCGFSKTDPEKLARARDKKAVELFGKYARLNFNGCN